MESSEYEGTLTFSWVPFTASNWSLASYVLLFFFPLKTGVTLLKCSTER